jgi:2-polyprenyl-3-methyl-5-hydroxy-6-metoxy-1,4-benzoquinol methylase
VKALIKKIIPSFVMEIYRKERRKMSDRRNISKTTEEVFSDIYQSNKWGGEEGEWCSGSGTSNQEIARQYIDLIKKLSSEYSFEGLRAVDLGCGDMRIGSQICGLFKSYLGADIVDGLIEHNRTRDFEGEVSFEQLNMIEDELPEGDVCFVRQVLQHLSNEQIQKIVKKLGKYQYVFVTEHHPTPNAEMVKNLDKPHGSGIRLYKNSGVFLDCPPFSVKGRFDLVLSLDDSSLQGMSDTGQINTYLYEPQVEG